MKGSGGLSNLDLEDREGKGLVGIEGYRNLRSATGYFNALLVGTSTGSSGLEHRHPIHLHQGAQGVISRGRGMQLFMMSDKFHSCGYRDLDPLNPNLNDLSLVFGLEHPFPLNPRSAAS